MTAQGRKTYYFLNLPAPRSCLIQKMGRGAATFPNLPRLKGRTGGKKLYKEQKCTKEVKSPLNQHLEQTCCQGVLYTDQWLASTMLSNMLWITVLHCYVTFQIADSRFWQLLHSPSHEELTVKVFWTNGGSVFWYSHLVRGELCPLYKRIDTRHVYCNKNKKTKPFPVDKAIHKLHGSCLSQQLCTVSSSVLKTTLSSSIQTERRFAYKRN